MDQTDTLDITEDGADGCVVVVRTDTKFVEFAFSQGYWESPAVVTVTVAVTTVDGVELATSASAGIVYLPS